MVPIVSRRPLPGRSRSARHSYSSVASILKNGLDRLRARCPNRDGRSVHHDNIRGPGYYH